MGRRRRAIADQVRDHEGLSGLTQKFTIHCRDGECDFYLKVAWTPSGIKITKIGKVLKPVPRKKTGLRRLDGGRLPKTQHPSPDRAGLQRGLRPTPSWGLDHG